MSPDFHFRIKIVRKCGTFFVTRQVNKRRIDPSQITVEHDLNEGPSSSMRSYPYCYSKKNNKKYQTSSTAKKPLRRSSRKSVKTIRYPKDSIATFKKRSSKVMDKEKEHSGTLKRKTNTEMITEHDKIMTGKRISRSSMKATMNKSKDPSFSMKLKSAKNHNKKFLRNFKNA